jgi:hypothetical protein
VAARIVSLERGALPAHLNFVATGGLLRQLHSRLLELNPSATPTSPHLSAFTTPVTPAAAASAGSQAVDISQPCLREATLVVAPVTALRARVDALLRRFEEQPMLLQLQTICDRILRACIALLDCTGSILLYRVCRSAFLGCGLVGA